MLACADAHHCKPKYEYKLPLAIHLICGSQWLSSDKKGQYADFNLDGEEESLGCADGFTILKENASTQKKVEGGHLDEVEEIVVIEVFVQGDATRLDAGGD